MTDMDREFKKKMIMAHYGPRIQEENETPPFSFSICDPSQIFHTCVRMLYLTWRMIIGNLKGEENGGIRKNLNQLNFVMI